MMSTIPYKQDKILAEMNDEEIARVGMIAELDAVNLYEQLSVLAKDPKIKERLLDIAKEEKAHFGEFQTLLLRHDKEQVKELETGKKEVEQS